MSDVSTREAPSWYRVESCFQCRQDTKQLLHGYDEDGNLWKGHVCECRGFKCTVCERLWDQQRDCCR